MIDVIIEVGVNLFQSVMFVSFLYLFFDKHENKVVRLVSFLSTVLIFFVIVNFFTFNPEYVVFNESIIFIGLMEIYTLIFLKGNLLVKLIMPVVNFVINVVISFSFLYLVGFITGESVEQLILEASYYRYLCVALANITNLFALFVLLKISKNKISIVRWTDTISFVVIPAIAMVIIYCTFFILVKTKSQADILIYLVLICLSMIVVAVVVWIMISRISRDNEIKTKLLLSEQRERLYEENVIQTNEQIEKIAKIKHDMKNNLMCIDKMISDEKLNEAKNLCNNLQNHLSGIYTPLNTENLLLNAIVNVELEKASTNDIDFVIDIKDELMNLANSHDIVSIIGNLCDNAIEYLITVPDKERQMKLEILTHNNYYIITCKNKVINSILLENPNLLSNKGDSCFHGKGTQILKNIAYKYDGSIKNYEENDYFCSSIIIKVPSLPKN